MANAEIRRILLVATVSVLSLTALVAIFALLAGDVGDTELRVLATTAGFGLVSLIAMRGTARASGGALPTAVADALRGRWTAGTA